MQLEARELIEEFLRIEEAKGTEEEKIKQKRREIKRFLSYFRTPLKLKERDILLYLDEIENIFEAEKEDDEIEIDIGTLRDFVRYLDIKRRIIEGDL